MSTTATAPQPGVPVLVPVLENHRFDEAALARFLAGKLPGFDGTGLVVRQFQGGQSNPTFHLTTPSGAYVLRKKPPGKLLPSAHAVEREFRVMQALDGSAVPVPRMRLLCEDASIIGTPFFVMDHVAGRIFADRVMTTGTPSERRAVYDDLARVLAALHGVEWRAAGLTGFGKTERYMERQVERGIRQWQQVKVEEMPAMDRVGAWLAANLPADDETAIAHGDYRLGNVIIHPTEPRVVAVLDWELATLGHPLADLAYACLTYHMPPGPSGLTGVQDIDYQAMGIPTQGEFVASYCAAANRPIPGNLDVFIAFSMFRLASIVAGVWRRKLDGNASDPHAVGYRERYRGMAESAWAISRLLGA